MGAEAGRRPPALPVRRAGALPSPHTVELLLRAGAGAAAGAPPAPPPAPPGPGPRPRPRPRPRPGPGPNPDRREFTFLSKSRILAGRRLAGSRQLCAGHRHKARVPPNAHPNLSFFAFERGQESGAESRGAALIR